MPGASPGNDGWVALHLADTLPLTLPVTEEAEHSALELEVLTALGSGGAFFFRQLADTVGATDDGKLQEALWNLVWAGLVTNDTFAPVRALTGSGGSAHRTPQRTPRARVYRGRGRPIMPARQGPPTAAGRWAILPLPEHDTTVRAAAAAEFLLDRYGVVTRGSVQSEQVPGGFALVYKTLAALEEAGRARRGYFVEHLGAAQFSTVRHHRPAPLLQPRRRRAAGGAGDRLPRGDRSGEPVRRRAALAAGRDRGRPPAGPQGGRARRARRRRAGRLPRARRPHGAAVHRRRGGARAPPRRRWPRTVRGRGVAGLTIEKIDGVFALGTPFGGVLEQAGFSPNPKGMRLRG